MILHQRRAGHERLDVPGCFGCKVASVAFGGDTLVTRAPDVARNNEIERQWAKDNPAYRALRRNGLQPRTAIGAHELMMTANTREEVEKLPRLYQHREEVLADTLPKSGDA